MLPRMAMGISKGCPLCLGGFTVEGRELVVKFGGARDVHGRCRRLISGVAIVERSRGLEVIWERSS